MMGTWATNLGLDLQILAGGAHRRRRRGGGTYRTRRGQDLDTSANLLLGKDVTLTMSTCPPSLRALTWQRA